MIYGVPGREDIYLEITSSGNLLDRRDGYELIYYCIRLADNGELFDRQ
jgi:hypothetical protein